MKREDIMQGTDQAIYETFIDMVAALLVSENAFTWPLDETGRARDHAQTAHEIKRLTARIKAEMARKRTSIAPLVKSYLDLHLPTLLKQLH